ncbi:MAG: autoinducer binding domain-containing protein [Sphingosinicella sp.]|nr:autoinducer binding domain-containing protein [Sphingosinicella sp.]
MNPEAGELGVIGRFMSDIDRARCVDEAVDVLHDVIIGLGFPQLVYGWTRTPCRVDGKWAAVPLHTRSFPAKWDRDWERHSPHDPYFRNSYVTGETDWKDVRDRREELSVEEQACIDYAADWGLHQGLTVPVASRGRFAFITAVGDPTNGSRWQDSVEAARPLLKLVAHYFDSVVAQRFHEMPATARPLSERELECLAWSARGKTIEDIATIIDISPETVRIYLKRINQKLDTVNRAHAIARAVALGLIDIN